VALPPPVPSSLAEKTDRWFQRANASLLSQVPCRPGCASCCIGPFPITRLDVQLLQQGLALMPPGPREQIRSRAQAQIAAMESAYPKLTESPALDTWADCDIDRLVSQFPHFPCPALGPDNRCLVYDHRPLACRSMGIPTEEDGRVQGACGVQTFVPIVRLSRTLREEEDHMARLEAAALTHAQQALGFEGDEVLLPYGFSPR